MRARRSPGGEYCLGAAILAEPIVEAARLRAAGFSAGLLHDIGRLMMASSEPRRYARVVELVRRGVNPLAAEQLTFGEHHALAGYRLAARWELRSAVAEALCRARQVLRAMNVADGLPKERARPRAVPHPGEESAAVPARLPFEGGEKSLRARIEWYQGALSA